MSWFSDQPIRRKLLLIILLTHVVALMLMIAGIVIYEIGTYRSRLEEELSDRADFIVANSAPALAFEDRETAKQILDTLGAFPEVTHALLYRQDGKLFASYERKKTSTPGPTSTPEAEGLQFSGRQIDVIRSVVQKGRRLGILYMRADMVNVQARLMAYAWIILLVLLAIAGGALLLQALLRRWISEPLLRLSRMTERIAGGDLDAHVSVNSGDEIGQLATALNRMSGELAQSRASLEESHMRLEIRVKERTSELQQAHDRLTREIGEREKTEERLRQAQKMQAVGVLAGGIAHDFNNVLAAILGNAELALDETVSPGVRQNLEQILRASIRARDLVRQILTFSRRTERGRNPLRLAPLLKETYDLLRGSLPATIRLQLDIRTTSDVVVGDSSQIQQVLINLATNAAYAMGQGGGVLTTTLSDVVVKREGEIADAELHPGRYLKLSVQDTGTGMSDEIRKRIFEPFFTTKGPGQGTGMGLAVVYGIVKNYGGDIIVESKEGKGSAFHVFLPSSGEQIEAQQERELDIPGGSERILFVDDEPAVLGMMEQILTRLGYAVTTAGSGAEAWDIFRERAEAFDLVIVDQIMPDITGMDLAKKVLDWRPDLPVILFTGYSEAVSPEEAKEAGISEFVMKPIAKREAGETIRRVLDEKKSQL